MGIDIEYHCDECGRYLKWEFVEIANTTIQNRGFDAALYWNPVPRKIFCNIRCLTSHYM